MSYKCYDFTDGTTYEFIMSHFNYAVEDENYYYVRTPECNGDMCGLRTIRINKDDRTVKWFYDVDYSMANNYVDLMSSLYDDHQVTKEDIINHFKEQAA